MGRVFGTGLETHVSTPAEPFGWFCWHEFYDRAVEIAPPGAVLIEVGVFLGKSLVYLGEAARRANKALRVYGIDTWRGSPEFAGRVWIDGRPVGDVSPGDLLGACFEAVVARGLADTVTLIVSDSVKAADLFRDRSAHTVFLDAAHDEASVAADIAAWRPKVAAGGLLGGDDYDDGFPGVVAAVDAAFGDAKTIRRTPDDRQWWEWEKP